MPAPTVTNLPIVDFSACSLAKPLDLTNPDVVNVCKEVIQSMEDHGCIYLTNHGLPIDGIPNLRRTSQQFFNLPKEKKLECVRKQEDPKNGWVAEEMEYFNNDNQAADLKECFNISYSDIDHFPWPNDDVVPGFRDANRDFMSKLNDLAERMFVILGHVLSPEDPDSFLRAHENFRTDRTNITCLRNLYYAPMSHYANKELHAGQLRLSAHTDFGTFTFLFQDNVGGLEVQSHEGEWFEAKPLEGAVMIQAADMLERWTSGRMKAAAHRVNIPLDPERRNRARQSTAYFVAPNSTYPIRPLDGSDTFEEINFKDYVTMRMGQTQDKDDEVEKKVKDE